MKLIEAVRFENLELAKKLINEGYPLNEKDEYGNTALILASDHCHIRIVKELIKAGALLDVKNNNGYNALMHASYWHVYVEIIKELIKAGASLFEKDYCGRTVLDYNKEIWKSYEMQDIILEMYPDKYSFLEEKVGIHKEILLKLKMKQILGV